MTIVNLKKKSTYRRKVLPYPRPGGVSIVAEIGKNFIQSKGEKSVNEYLENAKELVYAAHIAGADAVKFQTHEITDEVLERDFVSPHFQDVDRFNWVKRNTKATPLKDFWIPLKKYCDNIGISFFSTPMSKMAAMKLSELNVPFWKVGSGDVQDYVLLDYLIETGKPIIISTGMVSLEELDRVIQYVDKKKGKLLVLYCVSKYPCAPLDFNLGTIEYLRKRYPYLTIGFSDHSVGGHDVTLAAVKLGAKIIEKHFSFSRDLWGADHKVSLTPSEMADMVSAIRNREYEDIDVSLYYGQTEHELEGANNQFRPYFNKTLVAGCDIPRGSIITRDMVYAMRPRLYANGFPSNQIERVINKRASRDIGCYECFTEDMLV